jgi:hypothetical protein
LCEQALQALCEQALQARVLWKAKEQEQALREIERAQDHTLALWEKHRQALAALQEVETTSPFYYDALEVTNINITASCAM